MFSEEYSTTTNDSNTNLSDSIQPDVLIVKGKFKFQSASIYGVFVILLDKETKKFLALHLYSSYFSDLFHTDIKVPWITLEQHINKIAISGEYASSITNLFKHAFIEALFNSDVMTISIIEDFQEKKTDKIYTAIESIFSRVQKDRQVSMELVFEEEFSKEIESIKDLRIRNEQPAVDHNLLNTPIIKVNPLDLTVPANPILSPISDGILSQKIKPGTKLLMKLDSSTEYGQQWIKTFNAFNSEKGESYPIIATVEQIGPIIKNSLDILVRYNPTQYTKFNIESGIKLKIFNPNSPEPVINPITHIKDNSQVSISWDTLFSDSSFKKLVIIVIVLTSLAVLALFFI